MKFARTPRNVTAPAGPRKPTAGPRKPWPRMTVLFGPVMTRRLRGAGLLRGTTSTGPLRMTLFFGLIPCCEEADVIVRTRLANTSATSDVRAAAEVLVVMDSTPVVA